MGSTPFGLALCFSTAEYAEYTKHIDVALNETVRIVSGCLKPTPIEEIYPILPHSQSEEVLQRNLSEKSKKPTIVDK